LRGFFRKRELGHRAGIKVLHFSPLYSVRSKNGFRRAEVTRRSRFTAKQFAGIQRTPRIEVLGAGC
jgi:hypothetical protein